MSDRSPPARRRVEDAVRLARLFSAGATVLYLLVGLATGVEEATPGVAMWAVATGLLFHVYAFVGNDVADLPIDRTDPRRRAGPLVRGVVAPEVALVAAIGAAAAAVALVPLGGGAALGPLVAALLLVGAYNLAGKRIPAPFVGDLVQGSSWGALVLAGAAAAGGATAASWWAAAAVVVYTAMVNGVHGALRDVVNDRNAGARTTASLLGADVVAGSRVVVPPGLAWWAVALHTAFLGALAGLAVVSGGEARAWAARGAAALLFGAATVALVRAHRARDTLRVAMAHGTWHLFLLPASLLAAATAAMAPWLAATAALGFVAPPWMYGRAVRGTEFGLPSSSGASPAARRPVPWRARARAMWAMTRAGNSVAAAVAVALGGFLAGRVTAELIPLMAAAAAAVAAANVFNDRCDRRADAVNRPERPIVTEVATGNGADRFVLGAAGAAIGAAALVSVAAAAATGALVVAGLAYSVVLRRAIVGHLTVAGLFAATVVYGGWLGAGVVRAEHWWAAALVLLFVFARETLKGVPDRGGDLAAGYATMATWRGERGALRVFRGASLGFCGVSVAIFFVTGSLGYLLAASVCAVAPTLRTVRMVRGTPSRRDVDEAVAFSGLVFATGFIPLLFLG